jgi:putative protease
LRFGNGAVNFTRIRPGDLLWRTHDPDLDRAVRPYLEPAAPVRKQPVSVRVLAREAEPVETQWTVGGITAVVRSSEPLGTARNRALDESFLKDQFGRLGNTPYELACIEARISGSPFAPSSLLNQLRREAVEELQRLQGASRKVTLCDPQEALHRVEPGAIQSRQPRPSPSLHLLVRTLEQLEAALELSPASITLDYLDLYGLRPSLERVRASGIPVRVASPRVLKPGEERIRDFLLGCECAILVRPAGLLTALQGGPSRELIGDFSLNAANAVTASELLGMGLARLTPAHDLNAAQIAELARAIDPALLETVAYQHLPVFHTEHCVFCRFLSKGTSYRDCGRPCEKHRVALADASGRAHPVMADVGCRNTVFGAEAQHATAHLDLWRGAGISHFRLEFAHETGDQVIAVTAAFQETLAGRLGTNDLAVELRRHAPGGIAEGSLFVPENYLTLPVLQ